MPQPETERTVVLAGFTGLIGRYLTNLRPSSVWLHGAARQPQANVANIASSKTLDLTDKQAVIRYLSEVKPDIVIHAAGEGRVDIADSHPKLAKQSIVDTTLNLIDACQLFDCRLVYISSNAVFGGNPPPYGPHSPYSPVNEYGRLKVEAEVSVLSASSTNQVIRPLLTYGWSNPNQRKSLVEFWLELLASGKTVMALDDTRNSPLYALDCAESIWNIALTGEHQIVNLSGPEEVTLHTFARLVARVFGFDVDLVQACSAEELGLPAERPRRVAYSSGDAGSATIQGFMAIEDGLKDMQLRRI